ncbi:SRPBCC family protein [Nocardioides maradonensis]
MVKPLVARQSTFVPAPADVPFGMLPELPLDHIYRRWYWVIPPIRRVIYDDGEWNSVGRKRTMVLHGGTAIAEVVHVERPKSFGYVLSSMTGLLAPLIRQVEGKVDLVPVAGGTEVTWQWTIHPRSRPVVPAVYVFACLWPSWALKALSYLAAEVAEPGRSTA